MKRRIITYFQNWIQSPLRMPLILRGARQVGKTWAVREFARQENLELVEINFELHPKTKEAFSNLEPEKILKALTFHGHPMVKAGSFLLFLDEIQECPQAIKALRYFKELMPELAVIATGSLMEFSLMKEKISWPVGRVEFAWLYPMSLSEFIEARGNPALAEILGHDPFEDKALSASIHAVALEELREYLFCGGMPAAVHALIATKDPAEVRKVHDAILFTYRGDFHKYAPRIDADLAEKLFMNAPTLVGSRFKYSHIDPDRRAAEIKPAVGALEKAGIIRLVLHTSAQAAPLAAHTNPRIAKLLFLDVGLMHAGLRIDREIVQSPELLGIHRGAVAEQFVGQELLATTTPYNEPGLWFWNREALNSQAEVDFVIAPKATLIPIEVKSGASGRLKSLRSFLDSHPNSDIGYRLYEGRMEKGADGIVHLPLYFAGLLPHLKA